MMKAKPKAYSAADSNVMKEAEEKKHGGRVKKEVEKAEGMKKGKKRLDKRARGGRIGGSDKNPFSSAASPKPKSEPSAKA